MNKRIIEEYKNRLLKLNDREHFCLYIDMPFCRSKCEYCIYNSLPLGKYELERKEYTAAVLKQLSDCRELFEIRTPDSIYFGGGTPSLWTLDELMEIKDRIPNYEQIRSKKTEAHPSDLSNERIKFYGSEMQFDIVSLGVQSFDRESCLGQKRIWIGKERIKHIVEELHKQGIYVNIDLVALFNGDDEENWIIFDNDLDIACNYVKPDVITSIPNYKTSLIYIEQIPRFRSFLKKYVGVNYYPLSEQMLSLKPEVIKTYGKNDHWIATKEYWYYQETHFRYSSSSPIHCVPNNQVTLAIGGADKHKVYGYISDDFVVYSGFEFEKNKFNFKIERIH